MVGDGPGEPHRRRIGDRCVGRGNSADLQVGKRRERYRKRRGCGVVALSCRRFNNGVVAVNRNDNLERAGVSNVTIEVGNGVDGWSARGPYDAIVVSGSVPTVSPSLLKQLRVGGRMTVIVGEAPVMEAQLITCTAEGTYNTVNLFETVIPALDGVGAKDNFTF